MDIFISKSGFGHVDFINRLSDEVGRKAELCHEDMFRPGAASASYEEVFAFQFHFWMPADVIIALLNGQERLKPEGLWALPRGMDVEVSYSIWQGKPVIFCASTPEALPRAQNCHSVYANNHPFLLSYLWSAKDQGVKELAEFCCSFESLPPRIIPEYLEPKKSYPFKYNVCRPTAAGWEYVDLSAILLRPVVIITYCTHVFVHSPYRETPTSPFRMFAQDLVITDPGRGLIEGSICLGECGFGGMRVQWEPLEGTWADTDVDPWGIQMLHWDFTCRPSGQRF